MVKVGHCDLLDKVRIFEVDERLATVVEDKIPGNDMTGLQISVGKRDGLSLSILLFIGKGVVQILVEIHETLCLLYQRPSIAIEELWLD